MLNKNCSRKLQTFLAQFEKVVLIFVRLIIQIDESKEMTRIDLNYSLVIIKIICKRINKYFVSSVLHSIRLKRIFQFF